VLVISYDILIYLKSWEEHLQHVMQVLARLLDQSFFANQKKCNFGNSKVGVYVSISREGILQWLFPKKLNALRGFLGLTRCYRQFVSKYCHIMRPLTNLEKGKFNQHKRV